MAAPVDSNRVATNVATAATSFNINVGSPSAGQLLIVFVRFAGAMGTVTFTGFTQLVADNTDASDDEQRIYYKVATGSEGATQPMSCTAVQKLAAICWVITGAENPATTPPMVSAVVIGTAANINPGSVMVPPGAIVLDYLAAGSGLETAIGNTTQQMLAQSFNATGAVTCVTLPLAKESSPIDNLIVEIRTDDGTGKPSSTVIGNSISLASSSLASITGGLVNFTFGVNAPTVSGTKYWIVQRRSGSVSGTDFYYGARQNGDFYAGQSGANHNGTAWSAFGGGLDQPFRTYEVVAADALFLTVIGLDSETATATQPAGYSNLAAANSGTGGAVATNCMIWGASKAATAVTSDDPAAWTSSAPNAGVTAWTIAIPAPAPAGAPGPIIMPQRRRRLARFTTFR